VFSMIGLLLAGLLALVAGAEVLVRGASRLALSWGISPLVVGLTIVALGTSAPEVAVAIGASIEGKVNIAMGNVVGSNIFNVLFVLGVSALIAPLVVDKQIIRQEVPIMVGTSVLLMVLSLDGRLSTPESVMLTALLVAYTAFLIIQSRKQSENATDEFDQMLGKESTWGSHWAVQLSMIVAGLVLLVVGSRWLVSAATAFALDLGVSELIIGLTIVAAGTSMPEVATSVMASLRGERDIAIGNVVGSCIFNILGSLGIAGIVAPAGLQVASAILNFDIWVMLAVAFACLPVFVTGRKIARWEGAVFLGYYVAYTVYLILTAQEHEVLQPYSTAMMSFVIPLTIITLVVVLIRPRATEPSRH
jgi:cation:H+ antiporter